MRLLALFLCSFAATTLHADLDAYVERGLKEWRIPGLAVAVVKDGKVVEVRGYGVREMGKSGNVDADTVFAIGSTTKAFTAAAVGQLVDAGKLKWDDHVVDHWPEFRLSDPWVTKEIRVSDLLANHSGLGEASEELWYGTTLTRAGIIQRLAEVPITEGFRFRYQYRNVMFLAAGELIPHVAGRSWDDAIARGIFEPLGMKRSHPTEEGWTDDGNVARPHVIDYEGNAVPMPYRKMENIAPAGSITSCARDMAKWVLMLLGKGTYAGHKILEPGTVDFIQRSQTPLGNGGVSGMPPVELPSYCLGWVTESYRGTRVVWHNGGIDGMSAWVGLAPDQKFGVVILSNLEDTDFRRALFYHLADIYLEKPPIEIGDTLLAANARGIAKRDAAEKEWVALGKNPVKPTLPLGAYAGDYTSPILGKVRVALEDGRLVFHRTPIATVDLRCTKGDEFMGRLVNPLDDLRNGKTRVVFRTQDGKVTALVEGPLEFARSE